MNDNRTDPAVLDLMEKVADAAAHIHEAFEVMNDHMKAISRTLDHIERKVG